MNTFYKILLAIILITFWVSIIHVGIARSERKECLQLQKQSEEYELFTLTKDESDMCSSRGVIINARVQ